jgi:hypothetical protein
VAARFPRAHVVRSRRPCIRRTTWNTIGTNGDFNRAAMSMNEESKRILRAELLRIGEETREFNYIPSRYLQDVANSDPAELVYKYVLAKDPTDGFQRLWEEGRLDLTVENVAWRNRHLFPKRVGQAAATRLAQAGFEVRKQREEEA